MRLFLLPVSTRRTLIYCEKVQLGGTPSYADRVVNKASATWAGWEKQEKGWQKKLTDYGNEVFRRIPFEEWGLKTLPALSKKTKEQAGPTEVLFPGAFLDKSSVAGVLRRIATERQGLHRQKLLYSFAAMPVTIPFGLIPILPNIPFFYLAFRAWSHYKALYGAQYLELLIGKKLMELSPSTTLDELYAAGLVHSTRAKAQEATVPSQQEAESVAIIMKEQTRDDNAEDVMLLKRWNGKLLAESFKLPEMEVEIERAVEQVEKAIQSEAEQREKKRMDELIMAKQAEQKKP